MKARLLLGILVLSGAAFAYEAAIPYFARSRAVTVAETAPQSYITVDSDIWKSARADLADIRLYDGKSQVPYALIKESGGSATEEAPAKVLNLGTVQGHTEFDLDVSALAEYDRVRLALGAKNFISKARIQGRRSLTDTSGVDLGGSTLYDFSDQGLGANSNLKFSPSSFAYLHVSLAPGIRPDQVKGAYISNFLETKARWTSAGQCSPISGAVKESMFECTITDGMPVERLLFLVQGPSGDAGRSNFSRTVEISDEKGNEIQSGTISRVLMKRADQTISNENLAIDIYPRVGSKIRVAVENGDDSLLPITQVQALTVERHIYFDPRRHSALRLYYGDAKVDAPSYDYAKFFQQNPDAVAALLSPAEANAQFTGRPDDRPWSERHNWVLWAAMLVAIAVLGGLTVRGLKSESEKP